METGITDIQYLSDFSVFGSVSPAIVNRATGTLFINSSVWSTLPEESRLFILLHEAGHAALQTTSEHEADEWAFRQYAALGYPLTKSIYALSRILKFNKPEDYDRLQNQLSRAAEYDYYTNHNQKAKRMILPDNFSGTNSLFSVNKANSEKLYPKIKPLYSASDGDDMGPPTWDYGSGDINNDPGSGVGTWLNNVGSGLNQVAQAFATAMNAVNGSQQQSGSGLSFPGDNPTTDEKPKDYTWLWIGIAVAAMVAVGLTVYVVKSKK